MLRLGIRGNSTVALDRALTRVVTGESQLLVTRESVEKPLQVACASLDALFGIEPVVLNGSVRIERLNGHEFIAELIESFPGMIDSVTLAKPTLEDVFIDRTGHRFWEES